MATAGCVLREGDKFSSYLEFYPKFKAHQDATFTQFTTIATEKLSAQDELQAMFKYRVIRYQCKQGRRLKVPESKEERPIQRSFKVGCPVMMNVRLNRPKDKDPFLKITKLVVTHEGHQVSKEMFQLYPEQRRIQTDETDITVLSALTMKTSEQRQIIEHKHGAAVMTQDVYNMQRQLGVGKGKGGRDDMKCECIIKDIIAKGGHVQVGRNGAGDFVFVTFQTVQMKGLLTKYPECLVMDCTYKVNNYLYPLLTIMIIDGEGHGMPVFHAFLAKEDRFIMEKCLRIFAQQFNPDDARCFIVDKDMAEIAAIGAVFPGVPVNLCQFHIAQAVERYLKKELGRGALLIKVVLDSFMSQVNTESDSEFKGIKAEISQIVPQSVINYFQDNWWSNRHLWAACCNINVIKFHATTTNTLESYHGKIKKLINEKLNLSNVLAAIVSFDDAKITENMRRQILISNSNVYNLRDKDDISEKITKSMTGFGAQLVKNELALSQKICYTFSESPSGSWTISYKDRHHTCTINSCTCSTFGHLQIPCRHIFFIRKLMDMVIFEADLIQDRLKQSTGTVVDVIHSSIPEELSVTTVPSAPFSLHTVEGRHKRAKVVCDEAANFLSILGVIEFQQKLQELEEFFSRWSSVNFHSSVPALSDEVLSFIDLQDDVDGPIHSVSPVSGDGLALVELHAPTPSEFQRHDIHADVTICSLSSDVVNSISAPVCSVSSASGDGHALVEIHAPSEFQRHDIPADVTICSLSSDVNSISAPVCSVSSASGDGRDGGASPSVSSIQIDGSATVSRVDIGSWPKMTKLLKPRGRPGTKQRFTKLSRKRRREIPKVFSSLPENEKINLLIQSVSIHDSRPPHLIKSDELKHFSNFHDTILDEQVDISILEAVFEPSAWQIVKDGVDTRVEDGLFSCGHCRIIDDQEFKMVQCEHCLKWYHFECVNYGSNKKVKTWFCDHCM